jgi:DNA-binding transcriptional regulator YdaS (Cro superfamily)
MFDARRRTLVNEKRFAEGHYHVGIGVGSTEYERLTKRAVLVSDTLLLSHHDQDPQHEIRTLSFHASMTRGNLPADLAMFEPPVGDDGYSDTEYLYMHCPNLGHLGRWLLQAEPLLRAGSAWYLPSYSVGRRTAYHHPETGTNFMPPTYTSVPSLLDFMQEGRRVIAQSNTPPILCRVVRPVIEELRLPYLTGVSLDVFSTITVREFDSYKRHRAWLRQQMNGLDSALNAVDSERALQQVGEQIEDGIYGIEDRMKQVCRSRAVAASVAGVGTVFASLLAVHGPSLLQVVTAILGGAATNGVWQGLASVAEKAKLRDDPWFYVWALDRAGKPNDR